jgi:hypothetical protein
MRLFVVVAIAGVPGRARADEHRLLDADTFAVHSQGDLAVDAGFATGTPSALPSGLSTGIGAGVTRGCGCHFAYGARASWSQVTESTQVWTVTQSDVRLRAAGMIRHAAGRGTIALRLSIGPTFVREDRIRNQSMRSGNSMETKVWATLPAGELEAVVALHVTGPWLMVASGGPSVDYTGGAFHGGWIAGLGVGWQP